MSQTRHWMLGALSLLLLTLLPTPGHGESDFNKYKDLRNDYVKVTNIQERERTEDKYVESAGKVALQKVPYKEVLVTAELIRKPPTTMDTMFGSGSNPYLKICMAPFDTDNKPLDENCLPFHFESMIRGNVGTAAFRITDDMHRYEFHLIQKIDDKGSSIKLWVPTD